MKNWFRGVTWADWLILAAGVVCVVTAVVMLVEAN